MFIVRLAVHVGRKVTQEEGDVPPPTRSAEV